jgi:glycerol-3-phosphate cytidylyltransferase
MKTGITFGTFDLFHIGHLNILSRAKKNCDVLYVGVSSDLLNFSKKGFSPVYKEHERLEIVSAIKYVDYVFLEESLEKKVDYIKRFKADILFMGDDWIGKFDFCKEFCDVIYFPRTPKISTTMIKAEIFSFGGKK